MIEENLMNRNAVSKCRLRDRESNALNVKAQTRFGGKNFLHVYSSVAWFFEMLTKMK